MRRRAGTAVPEQAGAAARSRSASPAPAQPPKARASPRLPRVAPFLSEADSPLPWLYRPHTVTGLVLLLGVVAYVAFWLPPPGAGLHADVALDLLRVRGLGCACLVFLGYCALQLRDSLLVRPHPSVWRVVHGAGLLYLMGLVYLLAFPPDEARRLLRVLYPELDAASGAPLAPVPPEHNSKSYGDDCRIYTPGDAGGPFARVRESVDIFFLAHVLGWWAKAIFLRDWRLAWALSVTWELLEYSLQSVLPNFVECWWDHWVEDFLLCNGVGLWLGMLTVRWLNVKTFDWSGVDRVEPLPANPIMQLRSIAWQFTPHEFARYEWRLFERFGNFVAVCLLVVLMEVIELNAFVLKFVLYLPPDHPLNVWRLAFWFLMSLPATHEYYDYLTSNSSAVSAYHRLGPNLWLALTLAVAETLVSLKFAQETRFRRGLPRDFALYCYVPLTVYACWAVALAALGAWTALKFRRGGGPRVAAAMNALVAVAVAAFAYLAYSQDVGPGMQFGGTMGGFV